MSDGAALLAYCHDNPDDDAARLVYADWLEEQGDEAQAEFIRVQVALAKLWEGHPDSHDLKARETSLLQAHDRDWRKGLPRAVRLHAKYYRGLPTSYDLSAEQLLRHGPSLVEKSSFAALRLHAIRDKLTDVVESGLLAGVRELAMHCENPAARDLAALAGCADLRQLKRLTLEGCSQPGSGFDQLWRSPHFRDLQIVEANLCAPGVCTGMADPAVAFRLHRFGLFTHSQHQFDFKQLAAAPCLSQLEELDLGSFDLGNAALTELLGSPMVKNLRWLYLRHAHLTQNTVEKLLGSLGTGRLEYLALQTCPMEEGVIYRLAASPQLSNLVSLNLEYSPIGDAGLEQLLRATPGWRLRDLNLWETGVTDQGVADLVASPSIDSLTRLILGSNKVLGPQAATAIATSEQVRSLRRLNLSHNRIGPEGAVALANSTTLTSLRHLDLYDNAVGDRGAEALLESPLLDRLDYLRLKANRLKKDQTRTMLREKQAGRNWSF